MAKIEVKQNFDWYATKKKLVVFMPNFNGKALTEFSIERLSTVSEFKNWMIIIGNDNVDDNWDHLCTKNVGYFTLFHDDKSPRNGAFIRNYFIKRCQSEFILQKDGEVVIEGDAIFNAIQNCDFKTGWRAGYIGVLTQDQTSDFMQSKILSGVNYREIEPVIPGCISSAKNYLLRRDGKVNFISYFHYAFCVSTPYLQSMHGYDEDYKNYGWEDVDMYLRLSAMNVSIVPDYTCYAFHLNHKSHPSSY